MAWGKVVLLWPPDRRRLPSTWSQRAPSRPTTGSRQWRRLSPEKHRQTPAAGPGGDVVKILREKERLDAGTEEEKEVAPMQALAEVPKWRQMLREHGRTGDFWISDRSH